MSFGPYFAPFVYEIAVSTTSTQLVPGLTSANYVTINPNSSNSGDIIITGRNLGATGVGLRIKAAEIPMKLMLGYDNSQYQVYATTNGNSITLFGTEA